MMCASLDSFFRFETVAPGAKTCAETCDPGVSMEAGSFDVPAFGVL